MKILSPEKIIDGFKVALGGDFIGSKIYQKEIAVKKNIFTSIWIHVKREAFRKAVEHICELQNCPHLSIISSSDRGNDAGQVLPSG